MTITGSCSSWIITMHTIQITGGPGASIKTVVLASLVPCDHDYENNNFVTSCRLHNRCSRPTIVRVEKYFVISLTTIRTLKLRSSH